jgi:hypothetical protein
MSQQKSPPVRKRVYMLSVTFHFEVFEGLVDPHSLRGHTNGLDFIQALLRSILRHELWAQLLMCSLSHLFCKWHGVSLQACRRSPE